MRKKLTAIIMSAIVAATLCPLPASASALEAGSASGGLGTQASTKTVYVLTKVSTTYSYDGAEQTWGYNYKYNSNGLLTKFGSIGAKSSEYSKITYSGTSPKKLDMYGTAEKITCDAKGRITKSTFTSGDGDSQVKTVKAFTRDSKGRVTKAKYTAKSADGSYSSVQSFTYKYNSKGRVASCKTKSTTNDDSSGYMLKYTYDAKGNLTKASNGSYDSVNVYKDGRLATRTAWGDTYKYAYKAVKVPSGAASKVKAQQWALLNRDVDCTFANNPISPTSAV